MDTLAGLLGESARRRPSAPAVIDQPGRSAWSGLDGTAQDAAGFAARVRRLAGFLANLPLDPGATIGIVLPNGSEAWLSLLAAQAAGLTPCMLDVTWNAADLSAAVERADIRAVVTQGILGPDRPAATVTFVAAGFLRLRFLLGFGPGLPRGVTSLDAIVADAGRGGALAADGRREVVTVVRAEGPPRLVRHSVLGLISNAAAFLTEARVRPGDRILTFLPPDDLAGLATGGIAALAADAALEAHGAFESRALLAALDRPEPVHLVVPGWIAPLLAEARIADRVRSMTLVHQAPTRLAPVAALRGHVVDVVSLGETALLASARDAGRPGIALPPAGGHVEALVRPDGRLRIRGAGATGAPGPDGWLDTPFRVGPGAARLVDFLPET